MNDTPQEARDSAKQRARRIPLDYYRRLTGLDAAKWLLTSLASLLAGGYVLWTLLGWLAGSPAATRQFSPAPVARAHAAWETDCAACHLPGTNLRHDAAAVSLASALLNGRNPHDHTAIDAQCQKCHAGPEHHSNQVAAEVLSCAGCHREHQGRDADLLRVSDAICTACHANIKQHRQPELPSILGDDHKITSFAGSHPKFRSLAVGERKLKFNHRLHMLPGQYAAGATAAAKKRLSDIPVPYRDRLARLATDDVIRLNCEYCHEPDVAGRYYQPTTFERHCAACHSGELLANVQGADLSAQKQLPHRLTPDQIREFLLGLAGPRPGEARLSPAAPVQPIPGKTPGENLAQTTQPDVALRINEAAGRQMSEARCGKCHVHKPGDGPLPYPVAATSVPAIWLRHARFDHAAHRAMECFACHDRGRLIAVEGGRRPGIDGPQPIINDIDTCRQCHAPTTKWGTAGARHDCSACHRYHGGDLPPHGRGEPARGVPPLERHDLSEWMTGRPNRVEQRERIESARFDE